MNTTRPNFIIGSSILLLIISKLLNIVHFNYPNGHWDIDRTITLITFLLVFHYYIEKVQISSIAIITTAFAVSLLTDIFMLDLGLARIAQLLLLTALVEEILLRGVLFELLLKKLKSITVLVGSSLFFTLVHPQVYNDLLYGVLVLLTGLILGGIYLRFRKQSLQKAIALSTAAHMLIILTGFYLKIT